MSIVSGVTDSLRPAGKSLMEMFDTFTGRKNVKLMFTSLKEMNKNMKTMAEGVEKTNELVEQDTLQVVEAIKGLGVTSAMENMQVQGGIDQLVASMTRMGVLSENQLYFLEEIQNTDLKNALTTKAGYEDLLVAVDFLKQVSVGASEEVIANLKSLDTSLHDEKLLRAVQGIGDGLEEDRLNAQNDEQRGDPNAPKEEEEGGGFFDTILKSLGMAGGVAGIGKLAMGLVKKLGPWMIALNAIWDFTQGFINAADIVGKDAKDLDMFDKVMAGLSNVIAGLTFGLVDAKTVYKFFSENLKTAFQDIVGWLIEFVSFGFINGDDAKDIAGEAYDYIVNGLRDYINNFAENYTKTFKETWEGFKDVVGALPRKLNEMVMWLYDVVTDIFSIRSFDDAVSVMNKVKDGFLSLFSEDGYLGKVMSFVENLLELVTSGISGVAVKGLGMLKDVAVEGAGAAWQSVKNTFGGDDQKVSTKIQPQYVRRMDMAPTSQALEVSKKRYEESMKFSEGFKPQPIIVNTPAPQLPPSQPSQRRRLNNMGLDIGNGGTFD